ncbi:MAG: ComEC/Rec2 family competence protein [Methanomassiliicoccus sp.]|nr:ComEC/Rec2 family competence protein [Methanomassiliicoccus sp.]
MDWQRERMGSSRRNKDRRMVAAVIIVLVIIVVIAVLVSSSRIPPGGSSKMGSTSHSGDSGSVPSDNSASASPSDAGSTTNATVYFIDVGQGDAELIKTAEGRNVLIDAGPSSAGPTLVAFLRSHNATILDAFVLTHPDADHIGGAKDVLDACTVLAVYQSGYASSTKTFTSLQAAVVAEGCPSYDDAQLNPGDRLDLNASVTFEVMSINAHADSSNDASVVLKMTDGSVDILFEGDASSSVESKMDVDFGTTMDVEVLKVGHHGSASSTSAAFLAQTTPAVAIIEVGTGNTYGHPTNQTLDRLGKAGAEIYRTDLQGTIALTTDGATWAINCER